MKIVLPRLLSCVLSLGVITLTSSALALETQAVAEETNVSPMSGLTMVVATNAPDVQRHVISGMAHLLTSWDEAAFVEFKHAIAQDPNCLMAHWGLVFSCLQPPTDHLAERDASLNQINEIVGLAGDSIPERELEYLRVLKLLLLQENKAAARCFAGIVERWPRDPWAPLFLCIIERDGFKATGSPNEGQLLAREHIQDYLAKHTETPAAYFIQALLEETNPNLGHETSAVTAAQRAVELAPSSATARLLLGCHLFHQGNYEDAIEQFRLAEQLSTRWQQQEKLSLADNDLYFRAASWRAMALNCLGQYKDAQEVARTLMRLPIDAKRPQARGSAIQLWDIATLPLRLALGNPTVPAYKEVNDLMPRTPKGLPASLSPTLPVLCKQALIARIEQKSKRDLTKSLQSIDKLNTALSDGMDQASEESVLSYRARAFRLSSRLRLETQALLYPDSATMLLQEAEDTQTVESLLLSPLLPYPAEWRSAQRYAERSRWEDCLRSCESGLRRFPKHKGLEQLKQRAQTHLPHTNS